MRRGRRRRRAKRMNNSLLILCSVLVVLLSVSTVGGVVAYLQQTNALENLFDVKKSDLEIDETFDGTKKENVSMHNDGKEALYIRAMVAFSWKDTEEKPIMGTPVPEDYTIEWGNAADWFLHTDGFYYCKKPVPAGEDSAVLIQTCTQKNYKGERFLVVDVVGQSIQADLTEGQANANKTAVEAAWSGITVDADGNLTPKASGEGGGA